MRLFQNDFANGGAFGNLDSLFQPEISDVDEAWSEYVKPLMRAKHLSGQKVTEGMGLKSVNTANKFRNQVPSKREQVIMLAMMLGLNMEQTNDLLTRRARKFHGLYAKHPDDAIWIYLLNRGGSEKPRELFDAYKIVFEEERCAAAPRQGYGAYTAPSNTALMQSTLLSARSDHAFRSVIRNHAMDFDHACERLYQYLEQTVARYLKEGGDVDRIYEKAISINELAGEHATFRGRYYHQINRRLNKNHEMPDRDMLIALGLWLDMDVAHINDLLDRAYMGPLYPEDRLEGALIHVLTELSRTASWVFFEASETDESAQWDSNTSIIRTDDAADEALEEESVHSYIKRRLLAMNLLWDAAEEEQSRINDLLDML